jgi:hypothetical protein
VHRRIANHEACLQLGYFVTQNNGLESSLQLQTGYNLNMSELQTEAFKTQETSHKKYRNLLKILGESTSGNHCKYFKSLLKICNCYLAAWFNNWD